MENEIKIESGIPIPSRGKYTDVVSKMKIGDSIVVPKAEVGALQSAIAKQGGGITSRSEGEGVRVWMVEKKQVKPRKPRAAKKAKEPATQPA